MAHTPQTLASRIVKTAVDWSCDGLVLADWLASRFTYRTREEWCVRIAAGEITIDGRPADAEARLRLHQIVEYRPGDLPEPPADLDFSIVYEDDLLLVVGKPGNLCMHPSGPFFKHTLWHLLASRYGEVHFINRLDRETSGLLIAAKNKEAARRLSKPGVLLAKSYQVIVHGRYAGPETAKGFLFPEGGVIRKKRRFTFEMPANPPFESAETRFTVLKADDRFSLLRAELATGRMHQIRATLHSLGYPVAGDKLYGTDENFYLKQRSDSLTEADRAALILPRQALHSCEITFRHPQTGEALTFSSPLPEALKKLADTITE